MPRIYNCNKIQTSYKESLSVGSLSFACKTALSLLPKEQIKSAGTEDSSIDMNNWQIF
jgi:hypothetical protein